MKDGYRLVWADEFISDGKPDESKWTFEVGGKWHNQELQAYTDHLKNACVSEGQLHIRAVKEPCDGRDYTSARMITYPHAAWQYGYFEVRAKIPCGIGSWPAIWLMPVASKQGVRWPLCGEIDMMEHTMVHPDELVYSLHSDKYGLSKRHMFQLVHLIAAVQTAICILWEEDKSLSSASESH